MYIDTEKYLIDTIPNHHRILSLTFLFYDVSVS